MSDINRAGKGRDDRDEGVGQVRVGEAGPGPRQTAQPYEADGARSGSGDDAVSPAETEGSPVAQATPSRIRGPTL